MLELRLAEIQPSLLTRNNKPLKVSETYWIVVNTQGLGDAEKQISDLVCTGLTGRSDDNSQQRWELIVRQQARAQGTVYSMLCCKTKQAKNVPVTAIKALAEGLEKQLGVAVMYGTLPLKPDRNAVEVWSDISEEKLQKEAAKQTEQNCGGSRYLIAVLAI